MFVTVQIVTDQSREALMIPRESVVERGADRFVYRVVKGQALWTQVDLGLKDLYHYEVKKGLTAGDWLVTTGKENLTDQQPVRVTNRPAAGQLAAPKSDDRGKP